MFFFAHVKSLITSEFDVKVYETMHVLHGKSFSSFQEVSDVIDELHSSLTTLINRFFNNYYAPFKVDVIEPKIILVPTYPAEKNWADISISVEFDSKVISQILIIKCTNEA